MLAVGCFSPPAEQVDTYSGFFFGDRKLRSAGSTAQCTDCTLAIVKPHAVKEGTFPPHRRCRYHARCAHHPVPRVVVPCMHCALAHTALRVAGFTGKVGPILGDLLRSDLKVTAYEMFNIDLVAAEEFLEVYKGVLPEYSGMTDELAGGNLLAVELVGSDAVHQLRQLCGPRHVDVAQRIAPDTLRAQYGNDTIHNAVHCTDLDEDGVLESEYFFRILQA